MSAWKAGEVSWLSEEFEEGVIVDTADGDFYYLNQTAVKKLMTLKAKKKELSNLKFKLSESLRSTKVIDIKAS